MRWWPGLRPGPRWESLQRSPGPLPGKGGGAPREGGGRGRKGRGGEGREGEGSEEKGKGYRPQTEILATALFHMNCQRRIL